jgi:hypothetical protein
VFPLWLVAVHCHRICRYLKRDLFN